MSFLALSLSRKISYAKNFVLLPPEIPGGRYNLLLIAVNQIFYHRFIGLLLKLHDLLLCHISRTGFILVGQWWKHFIGNDSNLLIVFYVQIMPDDFVMQLHRF